MEAAVNVKTSPVGFALAGANFKKTSMLDKVLLHETSSATACQEVVYKVYHKPNADAEITVVIGRSCTGAAVTYRSGALHTGRILTDALCVSRYWTWTERMPLVFWTRSQLLKQVKHKSKLNTNVPYTDLCKEV